MFQIQVVADGWTGLNPARDYDQNFFFFSLPRIYKTVKNAQVINLLTQIFFIFKYAMKHTKNPVKK